MKGIKVKTTMLLLCVLLLLSLAAPAMAANNEQEQAAQYLADKSIYQGDASGNLNLDSSLTRAELAVILTRIKEAEAEVLINSSYWSFSCYFTDVAAWAKPYVGYCAENYLMNGYSLFSFGSNDTVTPAAACTVVLRHLGYAETDWDYNSAGQKAVAVGIADSPMLAGTAIKRGDMAIIIYRAMTGTGTTTPSMSNTQTATAADFGSGVISTTPIAAKTLVGDNQSREDFSQQANPAIFDDILTRAAYNSARQTIVDRDKMLAGSNKNGFNPYYYYAHTTATAETKLILNEVLGMIYGSHYYEVSVEPYSTGKYNYPNYFIVTVFEPDHLAEANAATEDIIRQATALSSDYEKVKLLNGYLCDHLTYSKTDSASMNEIFTSQTPVKGKCTVYASAMSYLLSRANIPIITLSGENHSWNMAYVDGKWGHIDGVANDVGDDEMWRESVLLKQSHPNKTDGHPEITRFAQELLRPGSTK